MAYLHTPQSGSKIIAVAKNLHPIVLVTMHNGSHNILGGFRVALQGDRTRINLLAPLIAAMVDGLVVDTRWMEGER